MNEKLWPRFFQGTGAMVVMFFACPHRTAILRTCKYTREIYLFVLTAIYQIPDNFLSEQR